MSERLTSVIVLLQFVSLDLGSHTTIEDDDAFFKDLVQVSLDLSDVKVVLLDVFAL